LERKKFRAAIPMPEEWSGRIEDLELPPGLSMETIKECAGLVHKWEASDECRAAPLIILIAEMIRAPNK